MNSSPVMVSFSYRYLASSSSFSRFSFRMPVAFSCCFFMMEMTSRSISAWVPAEQAREVSPPRYWLCHRFQCHHIEFIAHAVLSDHGTGQAW